MAGKRTAYLNFWVNQFPIELLLLLIGILKALALRCIMFLDNGQVVRHWLLFGIIWWCLYTQTGHLP